MSAEPRFATERDRSRRTLGPEVAAVMRKLGEPAMPWQSYVLDVSYELDEERTEEASSLAGFFQPRLYYRESRVTVPRQSGKTTLAKGRHVHRQECSRQYGWSRRPLSFYMAQTATDAREKLVEEWMPALEDSPYWTEDPERPGKASPDSTITQFLRSNGREAIKFAGGGRIAVKPPSRTGGHGGTPDAADLDEAFAHRDATAEQGVRPGMITKISPQLWVVSTAGTAESEYLWDKVDDGRARCIAGTTDAVCYFEWSAYPGDTNTPVTDPSLTLDITDGRVLARCSPALGHTIRLADLLADIGLMKRDEALRAYGNIWVASVQRLIPPAAWAAHLDAQAKITGRQWLAVDAAPGADQSDRRNASVSVAGYTSTGKVLVEVIDSRPGLDWLAERVGELTHAHSFAKVLFDLASPVRAVAEDIRRKSAAQTEQVDGVTLAAACQRIHEDIIGNGPLVHIGQDVLDGAVSGASKRQLLDSWAFARRTSTTDISGLVSVTLAYFEAVSNPPQELRIR